MMPPPQAMALTRHQQGALQALLLKAATDPVGMETVEPGTIRAGRGKPIGRPTPDAGTA